MQCHLQWLGDPRTGELLLSNRRASAHEPYLFQCSSMVSCYSDSVQGKRPVQQLPSPLASQTMTDSLDCAVFSGKRTIYSLKCLPAALSAVWKQGIQDTGEMRNYTNPTFSVVFFWMVERKADIHQWIRHCVYTIPRVLHINLFSSVHFIGFPREPFINTSFTTENTNKAGKSCHAWCNFF